MTSTTVDHATPLAPGTPAPDFSLPVTPDQTVSLDDFRGRPVILAFYPADWSPVCGDQMALYNEILPEFAASRRAPRHLGRQRVVSPGLRRDRKLHFPLLADFEPKGEVARATGVPRRRARASARSS